MQQQNTESCQLLDFYINSLQLLASNSAQRFTPSFGIKQSLKTPRPNPKQYYLETFHSSADNRIWNSSIFEPTAALGQTPLLLPAWYSEWRSHSQCTEILGTPSSKCKTAFKSKQTLPVRVLGILPSLSLLELLGFSLLPTCSWTWRFYFPACNIECSALECEWRC